MRPARPVSLLATAALAVTVSLTTGLSPARADGPGSGSPYVVSVGDLG